MIAAGWDLHLVIGPDVEVGLVLLLQETEGNPVKEVVAVFNFIFVERTFQIRKTTNGKLAVGKSSHWCKNVAL